MENNLFTVQYVYDGETKGTYKYVALDLHGEQITKSKDKLSAGANVLYIQKDKIKTKPESITATFTLNYK
jgi:hypothetical protein